MYVLVNDFEPDDRRELEATGLNEARTEALKNLQWQIVEVPDKKKLITESAMEIRMKTQIENIMHNEFLDLYNKWFSTDYTKADVDWDINGPE